MPVILTTPIEVITKEAVSIVEYKTVQIVVDLDDTPYIRVKYNGLNSDGNVVGTTEATLTGAEVADFITDNALFYADVKTVSYAIGKSKGVIPADGGVV